jgi:hypothetical protein
LEDYIVLGLSLFNSWVFSECSRNTLLLGLTIEMESSKNALVVKDPSSNALLNKKAWLKLNFIVNRDY